MVFILSPYIFSDISFDTSYVSSNLGYQKHLTSYFHDCKLFVLAKAEDLTNLKSVWEKILQENMGLFANGKASNGTSPIKKTWRNSGQNNCVIAMVKSLIEQSNREVTRNLFKFLNVAHAQPFGYHNGAIVTFKSSVPFLLLESNSSLAKTFV